MSAYVAQLVSLIFIQDHCEKPVQFLKRFVSFPNLQVWHLKQCTVFQVEKVKGEGGSKKILSIQGDTFSEVSIAQIRDVSMEWTFVHCCTVMTAADPQNPQSYCDTKHWGPCTWYSLRWHVLHFPQNLFHSTLDFLPQHVALSSIH